MLKFTRHAVDRYIEFHMRNDQMVDPRDVRADLEAAAERAVKLKEKTRTGQTKWALESMGCEAVTRHDDGVDVVVTILPPPGLRGLTPDQAERVVTKIEVEADIVARLTEEVAVTEMAIVELQAVPCSKGSEPKAELHREKSRLQELKYEHGIATMEHQVLCSELKAMRQKLGRESNESKLKKALRAALRCVRDGEAKWARDEVARIDPGLASDKFIDGVDE
jgi:hypothetical protein